MLIVLFCSTAMACAPIAPAKRGRLAQPDMATDAGSTLMPGPDHALEYREGAAGGSGAGGGGCGCG
ncbi:MAG: DUF4266 domain-containing protein [Planctomycetaceae bacterium]|nr:DUF4266 domain-containing protein [Planctomycetaceae bacterium]